MSGREATNVGSVHGRTDGDEEVIHVRLSGGPVGLPRELRLKRSTVEDDRLKLEWRGGYEHFERVTDGPATRSAAMMFQWRGRTKIAE